MLEIPVAASDASEFDRLAKDHFAGDTAQAHAALVARRRGWPVITTEARAAGFRSAGTEVELLP